MYQTESEKWFAHFSLRSMTALYVSPKRAPRLAAAELAAITRSIQQFQLGEGSRGQRLLERGRRYAHASDDPLFVDALKLFVEEEQQHSRYLASFMRSQDIPLVRRHWVDTVFRSLRGAAGLELSLAVLVTAELIAVPYYRALGDATGSGVLKTICRRILEDEAAHLRYQSSMLGRIASGRGRFLERLLGSLHRWFLLSTMLVVWTEHRPVFRAAGYSFRRFRQETLAEFSLWDAARRSFRLPGGGANRAPRPRLGSARVATIGPVRESDRVGANPLKQ